MNKLFSILATFFLVFSLFLPLNVLASNGMVNGEYTISFTVYKDGTTDKSVMDGYTNKPATLFVEDGKFKVHVTFNNIDMIHAFNVKQGDDFVPAKVIEEDTENKLRTVEIEIEELEAIYPAKTHVIVPFIPGYDNWYDVDFKFHTDTITPVNVEQPEEGNDSEEEAPEEDTDSEEAPEEDEDSEEAPEEDTDSEEAPEEDTGSEEAPEEDTGSEEVSEEDNNPGTDPEESNDEETNIYFADYSAIRADNDNLSSMDNRLKKPASIKEQNGKKYVSLSFTEEGKEYVTGWELQKADGTWVAANDNLDIIDFMITNVEEPILARVSMEVPLSGGNVYKNTQLFRIVFVTDENKDSDPVEQPETPKEDEEQFEIPGESIEDTEQSETPEEGEQSKTPEVPKEEQSENPDEKEQTDVPEDAVEEYSIDFKVLKDGTSLVSVMDQYTEKPAILTVEDGKNYIYLTLTNSDWIKVFQTEVNGMMKDAEVVSTDLEANKRVVKFEVANLSEKLNAYTEVFIPSINYDGKYNVQFQFYPDSKTLVNGAIPESGQAGNGDQTDNNNDQTKDNQTADQTDKNKGMMENNESDDNYDPATDNEQSGANDRSDNQDEMVGNNELDNNSSNDMNKDTSNNEDEDRLTYPEGSNGENPSHTIKSNTGDNPKTNDFSTIGLSLAILFGSSIYILFRLRKAKAVK